MDSKSLRSFDGHLDKGEKLLVDIGWSQLNACCLILLCCSYPIYLTYYGHVDYYIIIIDY